MQEDDYQLYVIAEMKYQNAHPGLSSEVLFPEDWYSTNNYYLKNKILAEALQKGVLIADTQLYQQTHQEVQRVQ